MRVIDCDECGETVQGADDDALVSELRAHYDRQHEDIDEADARDLVDRGAYDAMDS